MNKFFCRYPATAFLLILLLCIAGPLMNGCSKKDQNEKQTTGINPAPPSTFFVVPSSTDPLVTAIAASLQRQDGKGEIELQLSRHAGVPKWDKALVAAATASAARGEGGPQDSVQVALIPFVWEDDQLTNAMLRVKISSADTLYQLIYAGQYPEFGFDKSPEGKWNALDIFHLFTRFDKAIFGHNKFLVKDKRILADLGVNERETAEVELQEGNKLAGRLVSVPFCDEYDVCVKPCKAFKPAAGKFTQPCCIEWATNSYCTLLWINVGDPLPITPIGGGPTPSPLPGGGFPGIDGSGGGGSTPIADPCRISPLLSTPDNLCIMPDGGWEPVGPSNPLEPDYPSLISGILNLSSEQATWLSQHPVEAQTLFEVLEESTADENPDNLSSFNSYPSYAITASKISVATAMDNNVEGAYDDKFWNTIKIYLPGPQQTALMDPLFLVYFTTQCIILKAQHPEWGKFRLFVEAMKETVHSYLDAVGMVPGIGEFADLANGVLYTIEGDGLNAKFSFAAAIPIAGWTATTAKWAKKLVVAANGSKRTLVWYRKANNLITFGDRELLRKVLGLAKGDKRIAHHIIPWQHGVDPLVQKAAQKDFHLNEILNGIPITSIQHSANHTLYSQKIKTKLQSLWNANGANNMSPETAAGLVRSLATDIRNWIIAHPNQSINDIVI